MRRFLFALTILLSVPAYAASTVVPYKNAELGVSCKVPAGWTERKHAIAQGMSISFMSPAEGPMDTFHENVSVVVKELSSPEVDLKKFTGMLEKNVATLKEPKMISSGDAKMAGLPAREMTYTVKQPMGTGGEEVTAEHWKRWVVQDGKAYVISYVAMPESFKKFYKDAEGVAKSLSLKKG